MSQHYQFHYSLKGNRDKPLILFLHGFMGNSDCFESVMSALINDFCCLAIDLPGHGKTRVMEGNELYTMPATAQGIVDLLDQLNIRQCSLVGYSMGGRLALYLAAHFQERFLKVIVESASPGLKTDEERSRRLQSDLQLANRLETSDFFLFLSDWYAQPIFKFTQNHPDFHELVKRRSQNNPLELAKSLRYMSTGSQPSLWNAIQDITIPLLLLVGEHDEKFKTINSEMVTLCESAKLEVIQNCGHNIHFENINGFLHAIQCFLI